MSSGALHSWWKSKEWFSGTRLVSLALGGQLFVAALLKGHQLIFSAALVDADGVPRWLITVLVFVELGLGLWLLSNWKPGLASTAALAAFTAFACYSLAAIAQARTSCGCFGRVSVNPAITLLVDLTSVGLLLYFRPAAWPSQFLFNGSRRAVVVFVIQCAFVGGAVAWTISARASWWLWPIEQMTTTSSDPEQWIGGRLPILDDIDIGEELALGHWTILLYRRDCPKCNALLAQYESPRNPDGPIFSPFSHQTALVEIRPRYTVHNCSSGSSKLRRGTLVTATDYLIATPVQIELSDGVVMSASLRQDRLTAEGQ